MEKDKKNTVKQNENDVSKRKWYSLIGFLISIVLLSIAIFMSINQERTKQIASLSSENAIEVSSKDVNRNINQVGKMLEISNNSIDSANLNSITNETSTNIIDDINTLEESNTQLNETQINNETQETDVINNQDKGQEENTDETNKKNEEINENKLNPDQFIKPVEGEKISNFSMNSLIYSNTLQEWITHRGIDIKAEKGTEVKASKSGKIKLINNDPRYGISVTIEHKEGFSTVYSCMLDTVELKEGDDVEQGQTIGHIGNSGVFEVSDGMHLHFEMLKDGEYINPNIYVK